MAERCPRPYPTTGREIRETDGDSLCPRTTDLPRGWTRPRSRREPRKEPEPGPLRPLARPPGSSARSDRGPRAVGRGPRSRTRPPRPRPAVRLHAPWTQSTPHGLPGQPGQSRPARFAARPPRGSRARLHPQLHRRPVARVHPAERAAPRVGRVSAGPARGQPPRQQQWTTAVGRAGAPQHHRAAWQPGNPSVQWAVQQSHGTSGP